VSDERTPIQYAFDWMEQQAERGRERPSQIRLEIAARQQAAADAIREMQAQLASVTAERDRLREAVETKNTVINELEGELAAAQHVLRNATCGMVEARHGQRELLQKTQQLEGERDELIKDKVRLDWVDMNADSAVNDTRGWEIYGYTTVKGATIRNAIDAALRGEGEP